MRGRCEGVIKLSIKRRRPKWNNVCMRNPEGRLAHLRSKGSLSDASKYNIYLKLLIVSAMRVIGIFSSKVAASETCDGSLSKRPRDVMRTCFLQNTAPCTRTLVDALSLDTKYKYIMICIIPYLYRNTQNFSGRMFVE